MDIYEENITTVGGCILVKDIYNNSQNTGGTNTSGTNTDGTNTGGTNTGGTNTGGTNTLDIKNKHLNLSRFTNLGIPIFFKFKIPF
jgi:hypothetical protein